MMGWVGRAIAIVIGTSVVAGSQSLWGQGLELQSPSDAMLYRAAISSAEKALRLNETAEAVRWLAAAPAARRGWEWELLRSMSDESAMVHGGVPEDATAIDVSPDGTMLAVARADGGVFLLRLPSCEFIRNLGDHAQAVYSVAFSPDGRRLATVSRDVTSRVWEIESGKELSRIKLDNPGVAACTFSPDGSLVATCSWRMIRSEGGSSVRGAVWIWDAAAGSVIHNREVGVKPLDSIAWSTNGASIAVGSWGGIVHVLDREGHPVRELEVPEEGAYTAVIAVAISPDGRWIAAGSKDRTARVWDSSDGSLRATCAGHAGFVNKVLFVGDQLLATCSVDATIRTWEAASGKPRDVLRGHSRSVIGLKLVPNTGELLSAARDGTFRTWRIEDDYGSRTAHRIPEKGTYTTVFSPDGTTVYCAMYDGRVVALDAATGEIREQWEAHADSTCNTLSLSGDGKRLVTCSWDKSAKVWATADQALLATLKCDAGISSCEISRDGKRCGLVVGKEIEVWDVDRQERIGTCAGHTGDVRQVAFAPDGNALVSVATDGEARVWDSEAWTCKATLALGDKSAESVVYFPDGQRIAVGTTGRVEIWTLATQERTRRYDVGDRTIYRLSVSPDGTRLAAGSDAIAIIDPASDEPVLRYQPQDDEVYFLAFSPDGRRLASCTTGGSVVISETTPRTNRRVATNGN
jgi:WD40 repeat protein